jgi:hypothetical protein
MNNTTGNAMFGNGTFYIATSGPTLEGLVSNDGLTWSTTGGAGWTGFINGEWVQFSPFNLGRGFRTSPNARAWTPKSEEPAEMYSVMSLALVGGQILGFGDGACFSQQCDTPVMAQLFGPAAAPLTELDVSPVVWTGSAGAIATDGTHVVVLSGSYASLDPKIRTTTLPIGSAQWTGIQLSIDWDLTDVVFAHSKFVAVGTERTAQGVSQPLVMTSTDGTTWEKIGFVWAGGIGGGHD